MSEMKIRDMPKLDSPFLRESVGGSRLVTPQVAPGFEWVFEDAEVRAIEKLDGTNVSVVVEGGKVVQIWNRLNPITEFLGGSAIVDCVMHSIEKGFLPKTDGQHFGEAVGEKIQANPLDLPRLWIPFELAFERLKYNSWGKYPKNYDSISKWFQNDLFSIARRKLAKREDDVFAEGVVFVHPKGRMAKLRRDMFDWYKGRRHGD
jgi:hypothetical protein